MRREIDGTVVSCPLYHITLKPRIASILQHGLIPAKDSKGLGFDQPYPSDENYVYLFNSIRMRENIDKVLTKTDGSWLKDKEILEVTLPDGHPLEREYEQATMPLRLSGEALDWFLEGRRQSSETPIDSPEDYVRYYFHKTHGIEYTGEFKIMNVCQFIDSNISDINWDENDGSYRTVKAISSEHFRMISVEEFGT